MISQSNLNPFNTLAIGQYTKPQNNGLFDHYGTITARDNHKITLRNDGYITGRIFSIQKIKSFLLAGYQGLCNISIQSKSIISVDTKVDTIAKVRTGYARKHYFQRRPIRLSGHVREDLFRVTTREQIVLRQIHARGCLLAVMGRESTILGEVHAYGGISGHVRGQLSYILANLTRVKLVYLLPTKSNKLTSVEFFESIKIESADFADYKKRVYFLCDLASFSRQVVITQAEKLVFSFFACSSTCSIKSCGKRIFFFADLLLTLSLAIAEKPFIKLLCAHYTIKLINKKALTCAHSYKYTGRTDKVKIAYLNITMPRSAGTLSRHLTTNIRRTNAMANSNDTLHPKNGQQHLSTLYSVLKLYQADIAQTNLSIAESHFDELQQAISSGIGAIGNLMYWATESDDYETEQLKSDIRDIGYLFSQLEQVSQFAGRERSNLNFKKLNPAINIQCY